MSLNKRKRLYDIDSIDAADERSVWQYAEDMFTHFLKVEVCTRQLRILLQWGLTRC